MSSSLPLKTATLIESLLIRNPNALVENARSIQRASLGASIACGLSGLTFSYAIAYTEKTTLIALLFKAIPALMSYGACFESYKLHRCSNIILENAATRQLQENGQVDANIRTLATRLHSEAHGTIFTKWLLKNLG